MMVERLKAGIFTASARAIEELAEGAEHVTSVSALEDFRNRVSMAFTQLLFALDQDERDPLPDDDDGIPQSRVNRVLAKMRPLDAAKMFKPASGKPAAPFKII